MNFIYTILSFKESHRGCCISQTTPFHRSVISLFHAVYEIHVILVEVTPLLLSKVLLLGPF